MSTRKQVNPYEAAEELVAALRTRMHEQPRSCQVTDLLEAFERAVGRRCDAVRAQVDEVMAGLGRALDRAVNDEWAVRSIELQLGNILAANYRDHAPSTLATELNDANQALVDVEAAGRQAVLDLENAVGWGDIDAVLRLRTESEVLLPNRLAEARSRVTELELAQAQATVVVPAERAAAARKVQEKALADHERAKAALKTAQNRLESANWMMNKTDEVAAQMQRDVGELTARRDAEQDKAERSSQHRLRKLAGLEVMA